jgi:hypothetical protein
MKNFNQFPIDDMNSMAQFSDANMQNMPQFPSGYNLTPNDLENFQRFSHYQSMRNL